MDSQFNETEQKILEAAQKVFLRKGMEGARMQEIADEAGINKALLHYYFRSKEKLFGAIFKSVVARAFPDILGIMTSELPIGQRIATFIERYMELLEKNPFLPAFILKEINRDPAMLSRTIMSQGVNPGVIVRILEKEMEAGNIRKMDPRDLMLNMISLVVFPFAGAPLIREVFFTGNKPEYAAFRKNRKESVIQFVLNSILLK